MSKEIGMLFSTAMVKARLDGRKTETRRLQGLEKVNINPDDWHLDYQGSNGFNWVAKFSNGREGITCKAKAAPGDTIYVKETHFYDRHEKFPKCKPVDFPKDFYYRADGECCEQIPECQCGEVGKPKWRPSIFMPKWAARLYLPVVEVRCERLQDITEAGAMAEGIKKLYQHDGGSKMHHVWVYIAFQDKPGGLHSARAAYELLWFSINGLGSWEKNPYVWVYKFTVKEGRPLYAFEVGGVKADVH